MSAGNAIRWILFGNSGSIYMHHRRLFLKPPRNEIPRNQSVLPAKKTPTQGLPLQDSKKGIKLDDLFFLIVFLFVYSACPSMSKSVFLFLFLSSAVSSSKAVIRIYPRSKSGDNANTICSKQANTGEGEREKVR
jgi:hypothetical protein